MERVNSLPTRVSKACDRCKRQKRRCDSERPCQHCARARTYCTTSAVNAAASGRSRLRRHGNTHSFTTAEIGQSTASALEVPDRDSISSHHPGASTQDELDRVSQVELMWDTPASSGRVENPISPNLAHQSARGGSNLPNFDSDSALAITRKIFRFQKSPAFTGRATSAIPGGGGRHHSNGTTSLNKVPAPLLPIFEIIGIELPAYDVCNKILDTYFSTVHWFSLVVYEPKFRARYNIILASGLASRRDHSFLLLLLMVLIMGCWYTPKNKTQVLGLSGGDIEALRAKLLKVVQRDFMELMDEDCLEFVQLCALLGSFYLYHGRPRSSFSILGAATKTSQAMDLHRDSENKWSFEDKEERIRVWWTIYTWDRPLGINDKDCNVPMPSEVLESVQFNQPDPAAKICLSEYQYRLNLVYRIASPLLEDIYGMRTSQNTEFGLQLPEMVATANQSLLDWYQDLPPDLSFARINDLTAYSSTTEKLHHLQALSLQLTFDNLMIVLHRPLLGTRRYPPTIPGTRHPNSDFLDHIREMSFERCLKSALRISNLQQRPNLFSLARTTHLVSFLGMNLFTASVVLFICALSDTLSDTAQEAKRGLKRTLNMQKSLSNYASLSLQCSRILEDLVQLILEKEMEDILHDQSNSNEISVTDPSTHENYPGNIMTQEELNSHQMEPDARDETIALNSTNVETSRGEGSPFKQSLETLQRVINETNLQRQQQLGMERVVTSRNHYDDFASAEDNWNQGGMINGNDFTFNEGMFTSVEDLGQFWLWDIDNFNF